MSELDSVAVNESPIDNEEREQSFFSVSSFKFVVMFIGTSGLYALYWFYKNWQLIQRENSLDIMPFWRAFFAPLWAFSLFTHISESAEKKQIKTYCAPSVLGALYFVLCAAARLPDPYWLVFYFAIIPLLFVNSLATKINSRCGRFVQNSSIKIWQWLLLMPIFGFLLFIGYASFAGDSVEEFYFRKTLEHDLVEKCGEDTDCIETVKLQIKPCLGSADWNKFLKNSDDPVESNRFASAFYSCIVDKNGEPYFFSK